VPAFVLTHHARDPIPMKGGTTFHFVTDGIESALSQARTAAGDRDVRIGGGVSTIRQYLNAGVSTICISCCGRCSSAKASRSLPAWTCAPSATNARNSIPGERALHVRLRKTGRL
jgi:hypothetical protein